MLALCMVKMMLENAMRVYANNPCTRATGAAEQPPEPGRFIYPRVISGSKMDCRIIQSFKTHGKSNKVTVWARTYYGEGLGLTIAHSVASFSDRVILRVFSMKATKGFCRIRYPKTVVDFSCHYGMTLNYELSSL